MAEVTYYFNAYTIGVWTDPGKMVDGDTGTFGYTSTKNAEQVLTGNSCPGTNLGIITKVELRLYGYGDGDDRQDLMPVYNGAAGDTRQITPASSPGWTAYVDITTGTNAPAVWTWNDVVTLDVKDKFVAIAKGNTAYCARIDIRVTYETPTPGPEDPPKYQHYDSGDNIIAGVYGNVWRGQSFMPATAHKIKSVWLKLARLGTPGTGTISIRATDAAGKPTGSDLCSGTIDGNSLTTDTAGVWYEITLSEGYDLSADTFYAMILRAPSGDASKQIYWRQNTAGTYSGGCFVHSADSGATWTADWTRDYMFEEWAEAIPTLPKQVIIVD
ncbi:MAG: hypothetical protein PHU08_05110 [Dehalococcoidales bacterium]|nr:hypothetical protein [Dehalococcoidales bacterium]